MTYDQLDINQKINVKAAIQGWAKYSVEHFQAELNKKVYGLRINKKGVQRSSLTGYRFGSGKSRTNTLRKAWWQRVNGGEGDSRVLIEFMLYGRFVDMGVGRGTDHTDRQVNRMLRLGATPRKAKPWYSKRKGYEIKRLREILAKQQIYLALDAVERAMNITVTINR